jgi:CarboxypepD_reg-like domain
MIFHINLNSILFMSSKFNLLFILLLMGVTTSWAQDGKKTGIVKGKLINRTSKKPANDAIVVLKEANIIVTTDGEGAFTFNKVPYGTYTMLISGNGIKTDSMTVNNTDKQQLNLGKIEVDNSEATVDNSKIPTIPDDNLPPDTGGEDGVVSSTAAAINTTDNNIQTQTQLALLQSGVRRRGYSRAENEEIINGLPVNNIENGDAIPGQIAGLNDVMRGRSTSFGLGMSPNSFGGLRGSITIDATAASQRRQAVVSYVANNRTFGNQIGGTVSTGLMKNGWAYSVSGCYRWTPEGYRPGTEYEGYSWYGAVSKVFGKHELNLTSYNAYNKHGRASTETKEAFDLAGNHFYNSNWGYQNGKKRNARDIETSLPTIILNYEYKPQNNLVWKTAVGYTFGKTSRYGLDWNNAQSPLPNYYRNLPSYYEWLGDTSTAIAVRNQIKANPSQLQVNWDRLYNSNYTNVTTLNDVNGIVGNNITGKESIYVLSKDVEDTKKFSFNTNLEYSANTHTTLYAGLSIISQLTELYRQVDDLLGGEFYVNYNQFAAQAYVGNPNFVQNNLNQPNALIKKGDKYGYDYYFHYNKSFLWAQAAFNYNKFDYFVAVQGVVNSFTREGLFRNGLFPNNSYGTTPAQSFFNVGVKGGTTYKISGRSFAFLNASYSGEAPTIRNTYISPATRDFVINNPKAEKNAAMEIGYQIRKPVYTFRAEGYATLITDATDIRRFYNDDPSYRTFINYVIQNENIQHIGAEVSSEVKIVKDLSATGTVSIQQAFYANNPNVTVYLDNDTSRVTTTRQVYVKNYYYGGAGPQSVYSLNLTYRPRGFLASVRFNYLDRRYVDINMDRRTPQAADNVVPNSALWHSIFDQEKLPSAFTMDARINKNINLDKYIKGPLSRTSLYISVGVNNVLDDKNIITTGFEQLRYDFSDRDPNKFPTKYQYGYGRTYTITVSLKF